MGPKSAFLRLTAGWQTQAAGRLIPCGLSHWLKMAAIAFAQRMVSGMALALWITPSLILFTAGLWCLPLLGATNTTAQKFETPPPRPGTIQWNIDQRVARERQERYRKHVLIPDALGRNVPRSAAASLVNGPKIVATPTSAATASAGKILQTCFFAAAFAFTGVLIVYRFAPQVLVDINRLLNPWALAPVSATVLPAKVRAEEEAFAKFLAAFRVGPSTPPVMDLPRKDDPHNEFYARVKERLGTLRNLLQEIGREPGDPDRRKMLKNLCFEMSTLKGEAGFPEVLPLWQAASALEGLLEQLTEKIRNVTPSILRTVAGGLDLLDDLCVPGLPPDLLTDRPLRFLVVDDDLISRHALSLSLKKAFSQPDLAENGETALAQTAAQAYDVIFLDVQMPGMDGFELCSKIRDSGPNRATPVVFVTIQSDFDARCKSTLSGGNDLMGKPFLTFEVTVKALTLALHGRLAERTRKPLPEPAPSPVPAESLATVTEGPCPAPNPAFALLPPLVTPPFMEMDGITNAFLIRASKHLDPLWQLCQTILQVSNKETRQTLLLDAFLRLNSLIPRLGAEVVHPAYRLSAALEGLLRKMLQNSKHASPSTLDTLASAVALLTDLCSPSLKMDLAINPPIHLLVVDDDLVARRTLVGALQTAFKKPESAENGEAALALAQAEPFDVIFLDVVMPRMDGYEVCSKIRQTGSNHATPVVFVTAQSDLETRAQMNSNGGDDLMGKPFLTAEIIVKALTFALRGRLQKLNAPLLVA